MCRTALFAVALAALTVSAAHAQDSPAKPHRRPASAGSLHTAHPSSNYRASNYRGSAPSRAMSTYQRAGHKPTPDEVGRASGMAIRRQLGRRQSSRRAAPHMVRARAVRTSSHRTMRTPAPAHAVDDADDATTSAARSAQETAATPSQQPIAGPGEEVGAATPPAETDWSRDDADAAAAPARATVAAQSARRESEKPDSDEASLFVPHSGMPAPLRGSLESLERQNTRLDAEGLERIEDEADLAERIAHKLLVPVPVSSALTVNADLPENHRYCRPWTARFLADLARQHEAQFHRPLEVSSAVRTVEYQQRLMRSNGNAAPAEGDIVSPHLTGATIDIAKKGLTREEISWMRQRLAALEAAGKIDVEEEFRQSCFHITVYKDYAPPRPALPGKPSRPGGKSRPATSDTDATTSQGA